MSKITITGETSKSKEEIQNQLLSLIRSRLSSIKEEIQEINEEINQFQTKYQLDSDAFSKKFHAGQLGDDEDYFVWDGLIQVLTDLQSEQETLRELV